MLPPPGNVSDRSRTRKDASQRRPQIRIADGRAADYARTSKSGWRAGASPGGGARDRGFLGRVGAPLRRRFGSSGDMATDEPRNPLLLQAFAIVDEAPDVEAAITRLRDLLGVDHLVSIRRSSGSARR